MLYCIMSAVAEGKLHILTYNFLSPAVLALLLSQEENTHIGIIKIHVSETEGCEVEIELQFLQMADAINIY